MGFLTKVVEEAKKRKELKAIEDEAYNKQREIEGDVKWQEAKKKAEERGVEKAKTTPAERLKKIIKDRQEKVACKRADDKFTELFVKETKPKNREPMIKDNKDYTALLRGRK